jgi:8-oxo-dGTP pyrophosphatase MutT (NUDIX family)
VIERRAGRVVLLDEAGRILLLQGFDPTRDDPPWWFTPGGGTEGDEDARTAARRELFEETGLDFVDLIGPIWLREAEFIFYGEQYHQSEEFFLARVGAHELIDDAWTELERQTVIGHRWFTASEVRLLEDPVYPVQLADRLEQLAREGAPADPIRID